MTGNNQDKPSLSYKDAGVDIDAGNALVERIKGVSARTRRPEVLGGLGGFGALCEIPGATANRCGYPAPTAWAPNSGWPWIWASTTLSASTWSPCA